MKLTPLQERLIAAYQPPAQRLAPAEPLMATRKAADQHDRLELSPQAAAAQRIRSRLVGGSVRQSPLDAAPVAELIGEAGVLAMHQSPAALNAAATGVAAGQRLDTTA